MENITYSTSRFLKKNDGKAPLTLNKDVL